MCALKLVRYNLPLGCDTGQIDPFWWWCVGQEQEVLAGQNQQHLYL